jgi:hypothetical protein
VAHVIVTVPQMQYQQQQGGVAYGAPMVMMQPPKY